jgi:hypothetical protein
MFLIMHEATNLFDANWFIFSAGSLATDLQFTVTRSIRVHCELCDVTNPNTGLLYSSASHKALLGIDCCITNTKQECEIHSTSANRKGIHNDTHTNTSLIKIKHFTTKTVITVVVAVQLMTAAAVGTPPGTARRDIKA